MSMGAKEDVDGKAPSTLVKDLVASVRHSIPYPTLSYHTLLGKERGQDLFVDNHTPRGSSPLWRMGCIVV